MQHAHKKITNKKKHTRLLVLLHMKPIFQVNATLIGELCKCCWFLLPIHLACQVCLKTITSLQFNMSLNFMLKLSNALSNWIEMDWIWFFFST